MRLVNESPLCWLAAPTHASAPAASARRHDQQERESHPGDEPASASHRPDQQVVETTVGLLLTRRVHLVGCNQRDERGDDEERESEVGLGSQTMTSQTGEDLTESGRTRDRLRRGLRDQTEHQAHGADPDEPTQRDTAAQASRQTHVTVQQRRMRDRPVAIGEHARTKVTTAGKEHGEAQQHRHEDDDRDERRGLRARERVEVVDPTKGARPTQPMEAGHRSANQSQDERDTERTRRE